MHTKFLKFLHKSSRTNFSSFILFQGLKLKVYRSVLMSSNWVDIQKIPIRVSKQSVLILLVMRMIPIGIQVI